MTPPVLRVRDLRKTFTLHLRDGLRLPVLQGVSFEVHGGECVALVGPSGQGKSTLMKCLHGSYGADGGEVLLSRDDGSTLDLASATPQQVIAVRRRELAYVSQFLRVVPRVPALDVVAERRVDADPAAASLDEAGHERALAAAREEAAALLERLQVPRGLWELPPATFSGGEQQRVNIARGFIQPARLLLLDEPTASLDAANRRVVIGLIEEAKHRGSAVVGIFHDEEVRDAVATRCISVRHEA
ncbi:phosphonate C-P lyase system protein PhnL [Aquabacterium sp. A7-Y]|uniref:phosphonate C-P lyase system protein PhnL n=1 Tax=Aquabacterium sp. A7-Y TaxID=1349605 RepID=UPI00223E7CAF|nr:phosphonate C-P lyase system protein PhnL [Aquabacterium sp. A7-Y]MCW7541337.1 phosphonate C-P lyase system protein PhnL [Aquabacterium sp. A7-Y]